MAVDCVPVQSVDHHLNRMFQLPSHHDFKQPPVASSVRRTTGHARFRRGPPPPPSAATDSLGASTSTSTSSQSEEKQQQDSSSRSTSSSTSSIVSSVAGGGGSEGSVSNGKQFSSSLGIVAPAPTFSSRKPPLPSTHRKRCSADRPAASVHGGSGRDNNDNNNYKHSVSRSGCHCCKRRKIGSKREIRRVPIIGSKVTSIPADDYSWKKYGEKKVDGSPYPRVYYKCSTGKGCPARKRVELSLDDSKMLLVTYDGEHNHHRRHHHAPSPVPASLTFPASLTGMAVESK